MLFSGQEPGLSTHSQLFEHFGESQHAQTTEAVLQAGLLPAQERRKGHFAKVAGRLKKSFRRPTCHAYDYAALIVPTAVCICIGMHAVKRRNRTHEIHNLHKTHRPRSFVNAFFRSQRRQPSVSQLQLFEHFGESQHAQTTEAVLPGRAPACAGATERAFCKGRRPSEKEFQTAYVPCVRLRCANRTYGGLYLHRYARRETA